MGDLEEELCSTYFLLIRQQEDRHEADTQHTLAVGCPRNIQRIPRPSIAPSPLPKMYVSPPHPSPGCDVLWGLSSLVDAERFSFSAGMGWLLYFQGTRRGVVPNIMDVVSLFSFEVLYRG